MNRTVAATAICMAILILGVARPVAASNRHWATGADVRMNLIANCDQDFTYPANTPFYVSHGWYDQPWTLDTPTNKEAFMGPATYFEFRIDRVPQPSTMFASYLPDLDWKNKLFISEYDQGMTGTHRFVGLWFIDGALVGGTPGESTFAGGCLSYVTFV